MSKQAMREEAERLIRETMEKRNLVIKQGNTRIEAVCGKCGAPNRISAERGAFAAHRLDPGVALLDDEVAFFHGLADQPLGLFPHRLLRHRYRPSDGILRG